MKVPRNREVAVRKTTRTSDKSTKSVGIKYGFRSGLEETVAAQLEAANIPVLYEDKDSKIKFTEPSKNRTYSPDFVLPNGIIIETKGRFVTADRQKHLLVKAQHPELDIRFVFSNSRSRISKLSATTYQMWCIKHGFKFSDKLIPEAWLKERKK
jgi:hypothetical protein